MKKIFLILTTATLTACASVTPEQAKNNAKSADNFTLCRAMHVAYPLGYVKFPNILMEELNNRKETCEQYKEILQTELKIERDKQRINLQAQHESNLQAQKNIANIANQPWYQPPMIQNRQSIDCVNTYNGFSCR